jgi:hypothetical protein
MTVEQDNPYQPTGAAGSKRYARPIARIVYGVLAAICLLLGLLALLVSPKNLNRLPPPGPERIGYIIGTFMVPALLLISALLLNKKSRAAGRVVEQ